MSYYEDLEGAIEAIDEYGRTVIVRKVTEGNFDPLTMTFANSNTSDAPVKAVFTDYKAAELDGSIILQGDKKVLIADLSAMPDNTDILIDGADHWNIVNIVTVQPGDTPLLYKLQVRR